MKFFICVIIAVWGIVEISDAIRHRDHIAVDAESQIIAQHESILGELSQIQNESVLEFVTDWRSYYAKRPQTAKSLAELGVIRDKIQDDPRSAERFTMAAKKKKADNFNSVITSFGGPVEPRPGL
jgi:hypothetical protein